MVVQLFVTFLKTQTDKRVSGALLQTLNQLLTQLPPLALQEDSPYCLSSFQEWLYAVVTSSGEDAVTTDVRTQAMESLISLVIGQGSLKEILRVLSLII